MYWCEFNNVMQWTFIGGQHALSSIYCVFEMRRMWRVQVRYSSSNYFCTRGGVCAFSLLFSHQCAFFINFLRQVLIMVFSSSVLILILTKFPTSDFIVILYLSGIKLICEDLLFLFRTRRIRYFATSYWSPSMRVLYVQWLVD